MSRRGRPFSPFLTTSSSAALLLGGAASAASAIRTYSGPYPFAGSEPGLGITSTTSTGSISTAGTIVTDDNAITARQRAFQMMAGSV